MTDRLPPPPVTPDDELPPCVGARMRDIAGRMAAPDPCAWEEDED